MKPRLQLLVIALILSACSTAPKQAADQPIKHADRVKVATYDSSPRPASARLDVYDLSRDAQANPAPKAHKVIALLTCEGGAQEEAEMMNAIMYRARQLGADGVVILPPDRTYGLWSALGERRIFSAKAIVYSETSR